MKFNTYFHLNEINEQTILYHRSSEMLEPGQLLKPAQKFTTGHWLTKYYTEQKLEEYRKENAPEKPSRFNCVFGSVVPRSVFLTKGHLYEVRPVGNTHATFAYYINSINETFENVSFTWLNDLLGEFPKKEYFTTTEEYNKAVEEYKNEENKIKWNNNKEDLLYLFNKYWFPDKNILKGDPKWIEVLCEGVVVVKQVIETEKTPVFRVGDIVEFKRDLEYDDYYGYDPQGSQLVSDEEKQKILDAFNGEKGQYGYSLTIPAGTKGKVLSGRFNQQPPSFKKSSYRTDLYTSLRVQPIGYNFSLILRPFSSMGDAPLHMLLKKV